jgi:hypothetical protein
MRIFPFLMRTLASAPVHAVVLASGSIVELDYRAAQILGRQIGGRKEKIVAIHVA